MDYFPLSIKYNTQQAVCGILWFKNSGMPCLEYIHLIISLHFNITSDHTILILNYSKKVL